MTTKEKKEREKKKEKICAPCPERLTNRLCTDVEGEKEKKKKTSAKVVSCSRIPRLY